jgi:crotonobetainyl-CoA:carnitine CoA-transferase CaiB-like acyl-CoA transferase
MFQALGGVRVLDLTRLLPGAVASMMLVDLGADVIKVEDPNGGDYARWMEPQIDGQSVYFRANNRGKRSMILNLKHVDGASVLRQMVHTCDVLIEGFRPGVMLRLGVDYARLKTINPRLVYCSLTGWGQTGPYAQASGHDLNYVSEAGLIDAAGHPQSIGAQVADMGGAYIAVAGILAGLFQRERTGEGTYVDCSLSESALPFNLYNWTEATVTGAGSGQGHLTGALACYHVYTSADGIAVSLAALEPKFWQAFCEAVDRPAWIPLHTDPSAQPTLKAELATLFASRTADQWHTRLARADCCFNVVRRVSDVHHSPQYQSRGMLGLADDGTPWMRSPIHLSSNRPTLDPAIPGYGQHTREILLEAGYGEDDIQMLLTSDCVKVN